MNDKLILELITKNTDFEPNYADIKDRVSVEKYISPRKKFNFNLKFFSLLAAAVMMLCAVIVPVSLNQRVTYIDGDKIIYESDKEFVDAFDYVFIARVTKKLGTKKYDGTGTDIPYTFYSLEVEEFFKGDGEKDERLCFYGGKNTLGTELYTMNDQMPSVGEYYLFILNRKRENSTNKRIGEKDFIIADNDNKILLENYKGGISVTEQEESIRLIIQRYKNIIDKTK